MYNSQLTTFVQVADSGSFNKAAEALYIEKAVCLFGKSDCGGPSGRGRGGHNLLRGDVHPQPLQTIYGPLVPGQ